jgi:hypothetical protein
MATANLRQADPLAKLSWHLSHLPHQVWDRFSVEEQKRMVEDDLFAGKSVSLELAALITVGLAMSIVSLIVIWSLS